MARQINKGDDLTRHFTDIFSALTLRVINSLWKDKEWKERFSGMFAICSCVCQVVAGSTTHLSLAVKPKDLLANARRSSTLNLM